MDSVLLKINTAIQVFIFCQASPKLAVTTIHDMKRLILLPLLLILVSACDKNYQISGRVFSDCAQTQPLANQELEFLRTFNRGTHAGKEVVATVITDAEGRFYADFKMKRKQLYLNHFGYSNGSPFEDYEHDFRLEKGANDLGNIVLTERIPSVLNISVGQSFTAQDSLFVHASGFSDTLVGPFLADYSVSETFTVKNYHPEDGGEAKALVTLSEAGAHTEQEMVRSFYKCQADTVTFSFNF